MAETRHRTVLEIGVDDRGLRQLAPTMERALNPKVAEAFEKSMERSTNALMKMVEQQSKLGKLLDEQARRTATRARDDHKRVRDQHRDLERHQREQEQHERQQRARMIGHANQAGRVAGASQQEGFLSQMLSGIPLLGPAFAGAVGGAMSFYQSFASQQIARARAFGNTGIGRYGGGLAGAGLRLGIGPSELPGMLGQLAQSGGVRGDLLRQIAPEALRMQALGGIDLGASGSLVNSVMTSTGPNDWDAEEQARSIITEGVAAGLAGGIREARIGEALQQIGSTVSQMRSQGIMLNVRESLSLMRGFGRAGGAFAGDAGVQAAQSITRGFAGAPDRESVLSALAIRHRMSSHGEDYETAARSIEGNPVEAFRSVMGSLSRFRGTRGFETMLRTQFQRLGINLSREQAHQLANMSDEDLAHMTGETPGGARTVAHFLSEQAQEVRGPMGTAVAEASYEARRARVGQGMAGTVQQYRGLELKMIQHFQPMVQAFAQGVMREIEGLFNAFREGGVGGLMERLFTRLTEVLTELPDRMRRAVGEAVGLPTGADGEPMSAGDMVEDAADAVGWAVNAGVASVLEFAGADPEGDTVQSLRRQADRHLDRGAARRGLTDGAQATDEAVVPLPGGGAARVETTTRVIVMDEFNFTVGR